MTLNLLFMPQFIERKDYDFIIKSAKFCSRIDKYSDLLQLDKDEIETYKAENMLLNHAFTGSTSHMACFESFSKVKIARMRERLGHIASMCKMSRFYTMAIGLDLGIEIPVYAFTLN